MDRKRDRESEHVGYSYDTTRPEQGLRIMNVQRIDECQA